MLLNVYRLTQYNTPKKGDEKNNIMKMKCFELINFDE